jgi:signal transduction histidine kinase
MEWLGSYQPDCVLLDYILPDRLGLDLLKDLSRQDLIKAPIIMLTGFGDEATAVNAIQSGAHGYIPKRDLDGKTLNKTIDCAIKAHAEMRERAETQAEIHARNKSLELKYQQIEAFYQGVLGKLKGPVNAIKDIAVLMSDNRELSLNKPLYDLVSDLTESADGLALTLQNLRDNPGLSIGKLLISSIPCSIVELVSETVNSYKDRADKAGIRISVRIQPEIPDIPMDRYRIEQVLINLLDNALKFTPKGGWIYLTADVYHYSPKHVTVTISDTGSGIEAFRVPKLFERNPLTGSGDESRGVSLGLHLCKEIIQSHNGNITVKSTPGAGSCISFTLPFDEKTKPGVDLWADSARGRMKPEWRLRA